MGNFISAMTVDLMVPPSMIWSFRVSGSWTICIGKICPIWITKSGCMGREAEIMKKKVCIIVFFGSWETRKPNLSYKIKLVPKSLKFGYRNWLKASQTRTFFIFCQIFDIFDDFSKIRSIFCIRSTLKNHHNMSKFWPKMKKMVKIFTWNQK